MGNVILIRDPKFPILKGTGEKRNTTYGLYTNVIGLLSYLIRGFIIHPLLGVSWSLCVYYTNFYLSTTESYNVKP